MPKARNIIKNATRTGASAIALSLAATLPAAAQDASVATPQTTPAPTPAPTPDLPLSQSTAAPAPGDTSDDTHDIIVTGTSIRGVPPTGSNLISVSREDVRTIGANTTADLLATVPQLNSFNTAPQRDGAGVGAFAPGLRALPSTATLPLLDGHRLVASGVNETAPDFPFIPDLAVERVEIVADGASAIYGSDAVAGVVNFITRSRYNGIDASVRYGMASHYEAYSASILAGRDWGSGSLLAAYQYTDNGDITGGNRRYRVTDFRPYGGVDSRTTYCPAANVLANTTAYGVNYAAPGLAAGTTNSCDPGYSADLFPKSRLHSGFVRGHQDLSSRITLWGEVLYSDRKDEVRAAPPAGSGASGGVILYNLPGFANPFFRTPPGTGATTEFVEFRTDNLYGSDHITNSYRVRAGNASAGVDAKLAASLKLSVYGIYDWARHDSYLPAIDPAALDAAASGTTAATALDPFGNGTSPAVAAAITNYTGILTIDQRTYLGGAKIDGPLFDLPGGQVKIAVGGEYRHEDFQQRGIYGGAQVPENLGRNIKSVYGELFVPLVGAGNATTLVHSLAISASGRYDDYSDFGSTVNPKVGVTWEPAAGFTLRGTYGTSFRAPGLRDVGATVGAYFFNASAIAGSAYRDPTRGAAQVDTLILFGGNKGLQPEQARTFSFGADLRPTALPNFHASTTFYDIHYTDVIGTPGGAIAFTDPTFASVVFRNPTPAQVAGLISLGVPVNFPPATTPAVGNLLDFRQGNFGVRDTNGLDFDVGYRQPMSFGALFAGVAGNYVLKFNTQLSPTSPASDQLMLGLPRVTLRGTLGVQAGAVNAVAFVNYRGGLTGQYATPTGVATGSAGAYTTVDLRFSVRLPKVGLASGTELAIQVNDLFDQTPPFFPATSGIGGAYNPIGRYVALNVRKGF